VNGSTPNTLPKRERLCGKKDIERLLATGKHGSVGAMRYIYATGSGQAYNRLLVSVPKKLFKRAVKRNLLKRRIRESWRRLKHKLKNESGTDILVMYSTKELLAYKDIHSCVENVINRVNHNLIER